MWGEATAPARRELGTSSAGWPVASITGNVSSCPQPGHLKALPAWDLARPHWRSHCRHLMRIIWQAAVYCCFKRTLMAGTLASGGKDRVWATFPAYVPEGRAGFRLL